MKSKSILLIIAISIVIVLLLLYSNNGYIEPGTIYISKIVVKDTSFINTNNKEYGSYLELYNSSKKDINLKNYYLSNSEVRNKKWKFPEITIPALGRLILFTSDDNECNNEMKYCHVTFRLDNSGIVVFSNNVGNILSKVVYTELNNNKVLVYSHNDYIEKDISEINDQKELVYNVKFNEYSYNDNLVDYGWFEIYNAGNKMISTENLYITDDINNLSKYKLPLTYIMPDDYYVFYYTNDDNKILSSDCIYLNEINEFGKMILSDGVKIIDSVKLIELDDGYSYGISQNKWQYLDEPTPGKLNVILDNGGVYGDS